MEEAVYSEDDLLPISALQHLAFCERQCALIHTERVWRENRLTAEGRVLHERTHEGGSESRGDVRIARGVRLRSLRLGLIGVADVVEFHRGEGGEASGLVRLPGVGGRWRPFPVEYKRGRPKRNNCDAVQLCAQAVCLEEMLGARVSEGALFYGRTRRRQEVSFTTGLRAETEGLCLRLHTLIDSGEIPPARYDSRCKRCSLAEVCLPKASHRTRSVESYIRSGIAFDPGEDGGGSAETQ